MSRTNGTLSPSLVSHRAPGGWENVEACLFLRELQQMDGHTF